MKFTQLISLRVTSHCISNNKPQQAYYIQGGGLLDFSAMRGKH